MRDFQFIVVVTAEDEITAAQIMAERIGHDESYPELGDPEYYISSTYDVLPG